ncbi:hypothetical protein CBS101457_000318 [Exobasidium rhododendri]|nr:hypothetical protein CBS101457_000318 [Exobasidium rhododendri]
MLVARQQLLSRVLATTFRPSAAVCSRSVMNDAYRFEDLSREELIARLVALEGAPSSSSQTSAPDLTLSTNSPSDKKPASKPRKVKLDANGKVRVEKKFDIRQYPCRKIALRFSYDGASYSGLATQRNPHKADQEEIATVEDVLWKALVETRLVGERDTMGGVGWSRCGRTDAGVSAGGQVVALWVRSKKVDQAKERRDLEMFVAAKKREQSKGDDAEEDPSESRDVAAAEDTVKVAADPTHEELAYVANLNSVLPPTIRIQAWSPVRSHFSSRFDCRYRHYKYFFTSGCPFIEQSSSHGPVPKLDISLMRMAAQKLLGDHDFQNLCRVDPSKQVENFRRRIDGISIDEVSQPWPRSAAAMTAAVTHDTNGKGDEASSEEAMYVLNLRGTAFLYHQVRHIVAILFLIGARLESPSIIDELLNVERGAVARDRLIMRKRGLVLDDESSDATCKVATTLPNSTATTMTGKVASDDFEANETAPPAQLTPVDTTELNMAESALLNLTVFDRKPAYEMASDRPLMLWDCGFKDTDIQWRSGTYDGPLPTQAATIDDGDDGSSSEPTTEALSGDVNSTTNLTAALLHSHWSSLVITAEMYKHFLLALPLDVSQFRAGYIPASTYFQQSSLPTLEKASVLVDGTEAAWQQSKASRKMKPLGNGKFKPLQDYRGLLHAKREERPEIKNEKYLQGRGKRIADKKALKDEL